MTAAIVDASAQRDNAFKFVRKMRAPDGLTA